MGYSFAWVYKGFYKFTDECLSAAPQRSFRGDESLLEVNRKGLSLLRSLSYSSGPFAQGKSKHAGIGGQLI